ncbi:hypothetical protein [Aneurinibacillus migulanus]|uniref:hypothetical protein n=1 Tax=Aneurinibacillus migulanus TaxID=47500 RepID=UPI001F2BCE91|nr:hypothetical protein [Aneurinibacillus migulanus]
MIHKGVDYPVPYKVGSHHTVPQTGGGSSPALKHRRPLFAPARRDRKTSGQMRRRRQLLSSFAWPGHSLGKGDERPCLCPVVAVFSCLNNQHPWYP